MDPKKFKALAKAFHDEAYNVPNILRNYPGTAHLMRSEQVKLFAHKREFNDATDLAKHGFDVFIGMMFRAKYEDLHEACRSGNGDVIRSILSEQEVRDSITPEDADSLLRMGCWSLDVTKILVEEYGFDEANVMDWILEDFDEKSPSGAVFEYIIDRLVSDSQWDNSSDDHGYTPMQRLCIMGASVEVVKAYVDKIGIKETDYIDEKGNMFGLYGYDEAEEWIGELARDVWWGGENILCAKNVDVIEYLLDIGVDPSAHDSRALFWFLSFPVETEEHCQAIKLLIDRGIDINAVDYTYNPDHITLSADGEDALLIVAGFTPLMYCLHQYILHNPEHAENGTFLKTFTLRQLLRRPELDVNMKNAYGKTALFYAAHLNNEFIVQALLSLGADIDIRDKSGRRAYHYTKYFHIKQMLGWTKGLMEEGPFTWGDFDETDSSQGSAISGDDDDVVPIPSLFSLAASEQLWYQVASDVLVGEAKDVSMRALQVIYAHHEDHDRVALDKRLVDSLVLQLIEDGSVYVFDEQRRTYRLDNLSRLMDTSDEGEISAVKLQCIERILHVVPQYLTQPGFFGVSPLMRAVEKREYGIVAYLLKQAESTLQPAEQERFINHQDMMGQDALFWARGDEKMAKMILERDGTSNLPVPNVVDCLDKNGTSILMCDPSSDVCPYIIHCAYEEQLRMNDPENGMTPVMSCLFYDRCSECLGALFEVGGDLAAGQDDEGHLYLPINQNYGYMNAEDRHEGWGKDLISAFAHCRNVEIFKLCLEEKCGNINNNDVFHGYGPWVLEKLKAILLSNERYHNDEKRASFLCSAISHGNRGRYDNKWRRVIYYRNMMDAIFDSMRRSPPADGTGVFASQEGLKHYEAAAKMAYNVYDGRTLDVLLTEFHVPNPVEV